MGAPYNLAADLKRLPLGVAWKSIGQPGGTTPSDAQNVAELAEVCQIATGLANDELDQDVRSSLLTEEVYFTSHWASLLPNGTGRLMMSFNPIGDVPFAAVSPSASPYPKGWTVAPAGSVWAEKRITGVYGVATPSAVPGGNNAILTSGGFPAGGFGGRPDRGQLQIALNYSHGWPHAAITAAAVATESTLVVDEVCACTGAALRISDGPLSEIVQVASITTPSPPAWSSTTTYFPGQLVTYNSVTYQSTMATGPLTLSGVQVPGNGAYWTTNIYPTGPGTLNLVRPLVNAHEVPCLVTAMPFGVRWGMALYTVRIVLERGLGTVTAPSRDGKQVSNGQAVEEATINAVAALRPFARVV